MKNLMALKNYIIIVLITTASINYAQDSLKIILLSKDIGLVVDSQEKAEYKILPNFDENFINAFFYLGADSQYYCSVKLKSGDYVKDTTFILSYGLVRTIATRIQYIENQNMGKVDFDVKNVELKFADGTEAKNLTEEQNRITIDRKYTSVNLQKLPINKLNLDYSEIIKKDFDVGISAGIIYNSAKFDGLGKIFNLLEENIPEAPYEIPKSNLTFRAYPLYRLSSIFIYKNTVMGELEYAFNLHNDNYSNLDYKSFAFSMSYLFTITKNLRPYVAIGYSASKFEVKKNYNVIVNSNGLKLESITLQGNVKGLKASLGTIYNFTKQTGVNIWGSYKFYPKVEVNQKSSNYIINPPTVNMKGFELGLSIYFKM
jgi:hypothetical protein